MDKTCFVCTDYVIEKTENLELTNPSSSSKLVSFFLRKILGIPTTHLEKISAENYFDQIVYCASCLERILYIQDILQELERLEKTLSEEKYLLESKLKESSAKSLSDSANNSEICTQQLRIAFVAEWKESFGGDPSRFEEIVETRMNLELKQDENLSQNDPFVHLTHLDLHVKSEMETQPNSTSVSDSDPLAVSESVLKHNRTSPLPANIRPGSSKDDESTFILQDYTSSSNSNNILNKHCELCAKMFSSKKALEIHVQTVHQKKYKFKCSLCDFGCGRMSDLNCHMTLHTNYVENDSKDFQCDRCSKKFSSERLLRIHSRYGHVEPSLKKKKKQYNTPTRCVECGRILGSKSSWRNHVLSIHRKKFKYKFQHCDYGTMWLSNFNRHITSSHQNISN